MSGSPTSDENTQAPVGAVIFDLDGTVIDTESLVCEVTKRVLAGQDAALTPELSAACLGKRPLEAWQTVVDQLALKVTAQQLYDESEPLLIQRWGTTRMMPGASRLLHHLRAAGIPLGVATSTPRRTFKRKMEGHPGLADMFDAVLCGDEVQNGKPAPDLFTTTAERLGVPAAQCLAIEDAPAGVQAATAAGMRVVVVPSLVRGAYPEASRDAKSGCCEVLKSLLDFQPQQYGLPAFGDAIEGTIPLDPVWRISGTVVRGFGRGSKELGIPTANLDGASLQGALAEAVTGIYSAWVSIGSSPAVYKAALSVGFNPFFDNQQKTAEPWILHDFDKDFYSEPLRMVVCAYIRPESNFSSLDALIARIHDDANVTRAALEHPKLSAFRNDASLQPSAV